MHAQDHKAVIGPRSEMQQLLKLLEDDDYVSRYKVCEDKVTVRYIFQSHPVSVRLFNTFPSVLLIDSTYKTNNYKLSLGFAFLESEKEDNVIHASEMCKTILKDKENMSQVIITGCDTTLMNPVGTVFPTSLTLLCKYYITKNVRSRVKLAVGTKQVKLQDGKMVKPGVVV